MSLTLAMVANMWLIVAYISIAWCLLRPVIVQQVAPAYSAIVVNVKVGNLVVSYGRKKEYYGH